MTIKEMQKEIYKISEDHGFHDRDHDLWGKGNDTIPRWLMLAVSELGEAMEAFRHDDRGNFAEELADTVIRIMDDCEALGIDLEAEILAKMEKNRQRPHMHGKKC
jgi:NTP pyrophosphatase (non-canonical NTP hydrolase)